MKTRGIPAFLFCVVAHVLASAAPLSAQQPQGEPPPVSPSPDVPLEEAQPAPSLEDVPPPAADAAPADAASADAAPAPATARAAGERARPTPAPAGGDPWRDRDPARLDLGEDAETNWYGWQTLIVDALSIAAVIGGAAVESEIVTGLGVVGVLVATPVVHLSRGQGSEASLSLGIRAALGLGFLVGVGVCVASIFGGGGEAGCALGVIALLGYPVMAIVDATLLAFEERERRPGRHVGVRPFIDARRGALGLAYAGTL